MIKIWNDKHRPQDFKDIVGYKHNIEQKLDNLQHLLFYGPPGTGKTTTAKIIIKKLGADYLVLNSSLDRKIDMVRTKVKDFVTTKASNNRKKFVFFDEADGLKIDTQESLRNFIETYSERVIFIFTANNINKIRDALRSRFEEYKFSEPSKLEILKRLVYICDEENCDYDEDALKLLIQKLYPDIRKMINTIQSLSVNGKEKITLEKVQALETLLQKVLEQIKNKNFDEARRIILNDGADPDEFFNELYCYYMKSKLSMEMKEKVNDVAMQCNFYSVGAFHKAIPLEAFIFKLIGLGV